jgi:hypothetical protein
LMAMIAAATGEIHFCFIQVLLKICQNQVILVPLILFR